jgi:hypothetical protein
MSRLACLSLFGVVVAIDNGLSLIVLSLDVALYAGIGGRVEVS